MEHTLGVKENNEPTATESLNPCSNGTYSRSMVQRLQTTCTHACLNPCSNGTYSRSVENLRKNATRPVLILVLMEHTLGVLTETRSINQCGLNPCSNGTYSRSLLSHGNDGHVAS